MQGFLNIREPWDAFELSNKEFIWEKYAIFGIKARTKSL